MVQANAHDSDQMVMSDIIDILETMLADFDEPEADIGPRGIGPDTFLVADLGCSSVEIVELAVMIEDHFDATNLPFQELLMTGDGQYVADLTAGDLASFVSSVLAKRGNGDEATA